MKYPDPACPDPITDMGRLQEIAELDLFSPETKASLQRFAAEAARRLGLPISLVSIVLSDAQEFAAAHGLSGWLQEVGGTPVEWSFCAHAVRNRAPFVVEDATTHPLVKDNPLVIQDGIRCYAGVPLISSRGHALGSLCVIGTEARSFPEDEMAQLRALAAEAVQQIEQRRAVPAV